MAAKLGVFTLAKIAYGDIPTRVGKTFLRSSKSFRPAGTSPHAWGKPGAGEARPEPYWPMRTC